MSADMLPAVFAAFTAAAYAARRARLAHAQRERERERIARRGGYCCALCSAHDEWLRRYRAAHVERPRFVGRSWAGAVEQP